jgi:hypothetical protein
MKKVTSRKEFKEGEFLPVKLTQKLQDAIFENSDYEYRTKNNFLQCVAIIYYHQVNKAIGLSNYVPLGREYWKTVYGGNYHEAVIEPLLDDYHIIESEKFGSPTFPDKTGQKTKGMPKGDVYIRYRINPVLLNEPFVFIPYIPKGEVSTALESILLGKQKFIIPDIPDLNFRVSIDADKANKWIDANAESICTEFLKRDYVKTLPNGLQVECREYLDKGSYNVRYKSVRAAKFIAAHRNQEFFFFKDTFYIANVEEFLQQRVPALIYRYKHQISQTVTQPLEEMQSPVTLRLYSHLTNFPSKILQFIQINNKTVIQLDLRTSQFLLFANMLNVYIKHGEERLLTLFQQERNVTYLKRLFKILKQHHELLPMCGVEINDIHSGEDSLSDVIKFIRDVLFTDFYAVVQQELGLQERMLAKHVLFKLLFKKTNRPDALLSKLSQLYPIVMNIVAEFKKPDTKKKTVDNDDDKHESNFSVFLQCIEAEIFVDNILTQLRKANIPVFTRHDSVVVANGYQEDAERIAKNVFNDFGFKYNHKVEDKFWEAVDFDDLEDSSYMQWLIDEDVLTTNYGVDNAFEISAKEKTVAAENMDEFEIDICRRLKDLGVRNDYYGLLDADFLEDISNLQILNQAEQNILFDEIVNQMSGFTFFQDQTNKLLQKTIHKLNEIEFPDESNQHEVF